MKISTVLLVPVVLLVVGGCAWFEPPEPPAKPAEIHTTTTDGIELTVELPRRYFTAGQTINVRITARNVSTKAIEFESPSNALHRVTIWRRSSAGWRWVNSYPQAVMKVKRSWRLLPGQTVKYNQIVPVDRDWPVGELLRLTAELIGGPEARCSMMIAVESPTKTEP